MTDPVLLEIVARISATEVATMMVALGVGFVIEPRLGGLALTFWGAMLMAKVWFP